MNINIPKEDRGKIYPYLPKDVQEAFASVNNAEKILDIGRDYNLSNEEQDKLGEAIGLVLLGILSVKEFQNQMYEVLEGKKSLKNEVIKSVQRSIFQPISAQLTKLDPQELLKKAKAETSKDNPSDMPVPPPPGSGGDTPTPSYGGSSDPYREPTDR